MMTLNDLLQKEFYFGAETLTATANPQQLSWLAMHQDHCSDWVWERRHRAPNEQACGERLITHVLGESGKRGHYGVLEHPQITFSVGYFPHSTMQQARTHRINVSFDVQSFRYTSQRILDVAGGELEPNKVFYLRPVGQYSSRQGKHYYYSEEMRKEDLQECVRLAQNYALRLSQGVSEEHARGLIPFDTRQHFVVSFNARSLMHFIDLRRKNDCQLEIIVLAELLFHEFQQWMPQVADWYERTRLNKAIPAP